MREGQEGGIWALLMLGKLEEAKEAFGEEIYNQYCEKWKDKDVDMFGKENQLKLLMSSEISHRQILKNSNSKPKLALCAKRGNVYEKPSCYPLIENLKPGDLLPLSDMTYYQIREDDLLLMATCERNTVFANATWRVIPFIRQLIIDLVCSNSAILSSKRRKEVADMLRKEQEKALKGGGNIAAIPDPVEYSRSMLRKFDPKSQNTLLYALVQSGKSPEQMRMLLIAWFVLGVQPVMHVQSASGRLVHGPQFIEAFQTFMALDKNKQKDHLVSLGTLLDRYEDVEVRNFVGLDRRTSTKWFREQYFSPTIRFGHKALALKENSKNLQVPVLLANLANGYLLVGKDEEKEEELFLVKMKSKCLVHEKNIIKAPVVFIFDEDDKQKGSDLSKQIKDPEGATQYEKFSAWKLKNYRTALEPEEHDMTISAHKTAIEIDDAQDEATEDESNEEDDADDVAETSGEEILNDMTIMSFRESVEFVVSVTATPIGTLLSSENYRILKQEKAPHNYYGIGNNNFAGSQKKNSERALDVLLFDQKTEVISPLEKPQFALGLTNSAAKIAEVVIPHMIAFPSAVMDRYRNCLLFDSRIGKIQQTLVHLASHLAADLEQSNKFVSVPAVFALEFHGKFYSSGRENLITGLAIKPLEPRSRCLLEPSTGSRDPKPDLRAPLRLWINEKFFQKNSGQILNAVEKISRDSFLVDTFALSEHQVQMWLEAEGIDSVDFVHSRRSPLRAIQFNKNQEVPELKHGFSLLKAVWECAKKVGTVTLGFTGSTPATDGRGVVNKDTEHEIQLTDQVLPSAGIDLTSLMQSLRISGCVKNSLLGKPKLWVTEAGLERVILALQVTEEFMVLKEDIQRENTQQSIVDFLMEERNAKEIETKYPGIHSLSSKINVVPSIRGKRVVRTAVEQYKSNHRTSRGLNHVVLNELLSILRSSKEKNKDAIKEKLERQFAEFVNEFRSDNMKLIEHMKSIFTGLDDAASKSCLKIVATLKKKLQSREDSEGIANTLTSPKKRSRQRISSSSTSTEPLAKKEILQNDGLTKKHQRGSSEE